MEASTAADPATASANGTHPDGIGDEDVEQAVELIIDAGGQLSMKVGGKQASGSSLRIVGGKISVDGSFDKGTALHVGMDIVVTEVAFVDEIDPKTHQVTGCDRRHKARIRSISVEPA